MAEYLSPGVYIEEKDSGPRPIEGVGTACAAFVGFAPSGPVFSPELVTNWTQFVEKFGALEEGGRRNPYIPGAYLAHAVAGYFANGGGRCYVARVIPPGAQRDEVPPAAQFFADPSEKGASGVVLLTVQAKGAPTSDIAVEISDVKPAPDATFTLTVRMGDLEEKQEKVSLRDGKGKKVVEAFNQGSRLVSLSEASPAEITGPVRIEARVKTIEGRPLKPLKRLLEKEGETLPAPIATAEPSGELASTTTPAKPKPRPGSTRSGRSSGATNRTTIRNTPRCITPGSSCSIRTRARRSPCRPAATSRAFTRATTPSAASTKRRPTRSCAGRSKPN